jgi:hypothetical protein
MKKLFENFTENTQKQLREQEEKHAMEIAAMKQANMDTQNLLTTKTPPTQTMNDHIISTHFSAMTKPWEIIFDGTLENWPDFEHHLPTETENPTIRWNQELTNFQIMDGTSKPFNFLEGYFDIPENMTSGLQDDLINAKQMDLVTPGSQLYKLHCLKTKLKNCITSDLARDIKTSIPTGLSNKDGHIFFIKFFSHTFTDKEAHKNIIYEYILKLEIIESNNMEGFQQEL